MLYIATQYTIVQYISRPSLNSTDAMVLSFTLPLIFLQLFETFSILGFAHQSIMTALALGYAIQRIDRQNWCES
ncbi:hypothetical protein EL22_25790 [Halostagnicola sp. A56]|nr:hypothetical protein EL22_25790 [Halostagnicola sp. A56]